MQRKIVRYFIYSVLFIFINGFIQKPISRTDESCLIICPIDEKKPPVFTFSDRIEIFDSAYYQAERYGIYKEIYSFFEKNPINFKSLDKGLMILHFKKIGSYDFRFDSIENCNSKQNTKVMKLFAKSFSSPAFTDSNKIIIPLFIRRSSAFSLSLDTFDIMNSKNNFTTKTIKLFVENGIVKNESFELNSIIKPYSFEKIPISENEVCAFWQVEQKAKFKWNDELWNDFIDENIYIPEIVKEEKFECEIKIFFEVDKSGKVNNITFSRINPSTSSYFESSYSAMEKELARVLKMQSNLWHPKKVNRVLIKSKLSTIFTLKFDD